MTASRRRAGAYRPIIASAIALILLPLSLAPAQAEPTAPKKLDTNVKGPQLFRYKFKAKESNDYDVTMTQTMSMDGGAGLPGMKSDSTMKAGMHQTTRSVRPDGSGVVETTYSNFDISVSQNGQDVPKEQLKPLAEMLQKMKSSAQITPRGEPKDLKLDGVGADMKGLSDSMKSAMVGSTPVFPAKGLKVGESWTQNVPMDLAQGPMSIKISFLTRYTFLGFANIGPTKTAVFRTDIDATVNAPKAEGPIPIELAGSGKGLGFVYFDNNAGKMVKSELEMKQSTTMKVSDPGTGQKQEVVLGQTTLSTMNLKDSKSNKK